MTLLRRNLSSEDLDPGDDYHDEPELLQTGDTVPRVWQQPMSGPVLCTAITADGEFVIAGTQDGKVTFLDRTGRVLWEARARARVYRMAVAAEAQHFVTGTLDAAARQAALWHFGGRLLATLPTAGDSSGVAITADGTLIVVGSSDRHLYGYGPDGAQRFKRAVGAEVLRVAVSATGDLIVATCADRRIRAYQRDGTPRWEFDAGGRPWAAPCIADEAGVVLVGANSHLVHCLGFDGTERWSFDTGGAVNALAITPDGRWSAAAGKANTVFLFDAFGSAVYEVVTQDHVYGLALSPDGHFLVAGANDHWVTLVDTREPQRKWSVRLEGRVQVVAISPDAHLISAGTFAHTLCVLTNPAQPAAEPDPGSALNPLLKRLVLSKVRSGWIDSMNGGLVRWFAEFERALRHRQFALCDALLEDITDLEGCDLGESEWQMIRSLEGVSWLLRGIAWHRQGALDQARACYERSLAVQQSLNNQDAAGQVIAALSLLPDAAESSDDGSAPAEEPAGDAAPSLGEEALQVLAEIEQRPRVLGMAEQILEQRLLRAAPAEQMQIILLAQQFGYLAPLIRGLSAAERIVRAAASAALTSLTPGPDVSVLAQMLRSPQSFVRWQALRVLALRLQDPAPDMPAQKAALWGDVVLADHASVANPLARREAVQLVRAAGDTSDIPWLIAQLADPDPDVRLAAIEALANVGDRSAIPALQQVQDAVTFEGRTLAAAAYKAISALEDRDPEPEIVGVVLCAADPRRERAVRRRLLFLDSVETIFAIVTIEHGDPGSTLTATCRRGEAVLHTAQLVLPAQAQEQHLAEVLSAEQPPVLRSRGRGPFGPPPLAPQDRPWRDRFRPDRSAPDASADPAPGSRFAGPPAPSPGQENNDPRPGGDAPRRLRREPLPPEDAQSRPLVATRFGREGSPEEQRLPPWLDEHDLAPFFVRRVGGDSPRPAPERRPDALPLPEGAQQVVLAISRPPEGWQAGIYELRVTLDGAEQFQTSFKLINRVEVSAIRPGLLTVPGQSGFGAARSFLVAVPYIDCEVTLEEAPAGIVVKGLLYSSTATAPIAEASVPTHTEGKQTVTLSWENRNLRTGLYRVEVSAEHGNALSSEIEIVSHHTARQVVVCHDLDDQGGPIGADWPFRPGDACLCVVDLGTPPTGLELQARWYHQGDAAFASTPQRHVTACSDERFVAFRLERREGQMLPTGHFSVVVQGPHFNREERCFEVRPAPVYQRIAQGAASLEAAWQRARPALEEYHPVALLRTLGGGLLLALALLILGIVVRLMAGEARIAADPVLGLGQVTGRFSPWWLIGAVVLSMGYAVLHTRCEEDQAGDRERRLFAVLHPILLALSTLLVWYQASTVIFGPGFRWPNILWGLPGDLRWLHPVLAWMAVPLAYTLVEIARQDEDTDPLYRAVARVGRWVALIGLGGWLGAGLVGMVLGIAGAVLGSVPRALGLPNALGYGLLGIGGSLGFVTGALGAVGHLIDADLRQARHNWLDARQQHSGAHFTVLDYLIEEEIIPVPPASWSRLMRAAAFSAALVALLALAGAMLFEPLLLPALEWVFAAGASSALADFLRSWRIAAAVGTAVLLAWAPAVAAWLWALRGVDLPQSVRWLLRRMRGTLLALPVVAVLAIAIASRSAPDPDAAPAVNMFLVTRVVVFALIGIVLATLVRAVLRAPRDMFCDWRQELDLTDIDDLARIVSMALSLAAWALLPVWFWGGVLAIVLGALAVGTAAARRIT